MPTISKADLAQLLKDAAEQAVAQDRAKRNRFSAGGLWLSAEKSSSDFNGWVTTPNGTKYRLLVKETGHDGLEESASGGRYPVYNVGFMTEAEVAELRAKD